MWTDERVTELKNLWIAGHSAREIADRFGTTRNAVLGKLHRVSGDATPMQRAPRPWSAESVAVIEAHWRTHGPALIADMLVKTGDARSPASVSNKASRMGLEVFVGGRRTSRLAPIQQRRENDGGRLANKLRAGTFAKPLKIKPAPVVEWTGPSVSILDDNLRHFQCRHIVSGEGVNTMFCGAPTDPESAMTFCPFHKLTLTRTPTGRTWSDQQRQKFLLSQKRRLARRAGA